MTAILYRRDENVVTRVVAGEMILVPIRSRVGDLDSVFTVTEVGRRIWELIAQPASADSIAAEVAREFEVDVAAARQDAVEFLENLASAGLVSKQES